MGWRQWGDRGSVAKLQEQWTFRALGNKEGDVWGGRWSTSVSRPLPFWFCYEFCRKSRQLAVGSSMLNVATGQPLTRALAACLGVANLPYPLPLLLSLSPATLDLLVHS